MIIQRFMAHCRRNEGDAAVPFQDVVKKCWMAVILSLLYACGGGGDAASGDPSGAATLVAKVDFALVAAGHQKDASSPPTTCQWLGYLADVHDVRGGSLPTGLKATHAEVWVNGQMAQGYVVTQDQTTRETLPQSGDHLYVGNGRCSPEISTGSKVFAVLTLQIDQQSFKVTSNTSTLEIIE